MAARKQTRRTAPCRRSAVSEETRKLRRRLKEAEKENRALRHQLRQMQRDMQAGVGDAPEHRRFNKADNASPTEALYVDQMRLHYRNAHLYQKRTYVGFLADSVLGSSLFGFGKRAAAYFRKIRLVRTIITVATVILAALQTSALFVLASAVYLSAIPFIVLGAGITLFVGILCSRSMNRTLSCALAGRHIRVCVPPRSAQSEFHESAFFAESIRTMAQEEGVTVFVVSPYAWSTKGLGGSGFFFTARKEAPHLYLVRRQYFFILRRRVLMKIDKDYSVLY